MILDKIKATPTRYKIYIAWVESDADLREVRRKFGIENSKLFSLNTECIYCEKSGVSLIIINKFFCKSRLKAVGVALKSLHKTATSAYFFAGLGTELNTDGFAAFCSNIYSQFIRLTKKRIVPPKTKINPFGLM